MKIPYSWLQEYLSEKLPPPKELADMLTMAGLEVEGIGEVGTGPDQIVAAGIKKIEPHPDADHLWVVQVDTGNDEAKQVITSAQNLKQGYKVPLAKIGAILPNGQTIEATRLRGLSSDGMLCSSDELGLPPTEYVGILVLPDDVELGTDVAKYLGINDIVIDVDVTPDRADCLCVIGVAREVAAAVGSELILPKPTNCSPSETTVPPKITIDAPDLCLRYVGALLENISIKPSPAWLQRRLIAAGMRPINSIVDITNYIMLETGQPLHAFDCSTLAQNEIIVRRARSGEQLVTLDGTTHTLTQEMLVIADGLNAQALAGVMGGLSSEITPNTKTVLLESACFESSNVRRTARELGFRTEASFRYERNVDPNGALFAVSRAKTLLTELEAGEMVALTDVYPNPVRPWTITLNLERMRQLIGAPISNDFVEKALAGLQLNVTLPEEGSSLVATIPTFRSDLKLEADLVEEVARLYGFDRIPSAPLAGRLQMSKVSMEMTMERTIRRLLLGYGLNEVETYSFVDPGNIDKLRLEEADKKKSQIPLLFPLSREQSVLRTTLLPSLLEVVATNQRHKARCINIFEINRVYLPEQLPLSELPAMPRHVALVLNGLIEEDSWHDAPRQNDFYRLKGIIQGIMVELGLEGQFTSTGALHYHPGRQAGLQIGEVVEATFGEIHPDVTTAFDLSGPVYAMELNLTSLLPHIRLSKKYHSLPRFPGVERDLSLVVPNEITAATATKIINEAAGPYLADLKLFDVYKGESIPTGFKSLAYSLIFRAQNTTLTEEQVNPYMDAILNKAAVEIGAKLRQ